MPYLAPLWSPDQLLLIEQKLRQMHVYSKLFFHSSSQRSPLGTGLMCLLPTSLHGLAEVAGQTCAGLSILSDILYFILQTNLTAITSLRLYALWSQNGEILIIVLLGGLVLPGVELYASTRSTSQAYTRPFSGCASTIYLSARELEISRNTVYRSLVGLFQPAYSIVFEASILVLTWIRTAHAVRICSNTVVVTPLGVLILRDGTIYFGAILALRVLNIITVNEQLTAYTAPRLTFILISRFMLNLRMVYLDGLRGRTPSFHLTSVSHAPFLSTSIIGNLGAPLDFIIDEFDADDDECKADTLIHYSSGPRGQGSISCCVELDDVILIG
ncbi:uncharacterized protein PHACADRAFT_182024 [Phanerochaete carnosa HHB-10118-sp]|uniref:Uncharacterized protein n=1 Tax=Phanerochaete carnosa (strain HHB-10118-sp) TaxID=650164 RepID=K5WDX6_PHACS|nr:uncharacterized protein PHACADRAFT_182024 [Phanerochaete carnosa HHB-10118-sp]EKM57485.1 hypothetical protein PHACADRAFT_182024 [Phanerochaete carnosa HHB-10118-sp]